MWTDWMYYLYCGVIPLNNGSSYWYDNYTHTWFITDDFGTLVAV